MKRLLLMTMLALGAQLTFAQATFSLKHGKLANSAYFGFKSGKTNPYIGVGFANITYSWDYSDQFGTSDGETKLQLIMPTIGIKQFLTDNAKLKTYLNFYASKPILNLDDVSGSGSTKISLVRVGAGFGAEYFLDNNFSVGSEFGLNMFMGKYTDRGTVPTYNYVDKLRIINTSATVSLNYYFGTTSASKD